MRSTNTPLRVLSASAAALALLALPAAAGAASIRTVALQAPGYGVATDGAGHVHVIESATQTDAIFNPDGTLLRRVALPGPAGSAENAVRAADGSVWVAIDPANTTGGLARVSSDGAVTSVPTGTLTSCGPNGLTAAGSTIAFTSYAFNAGGTDCSHGGVGTIAGSTPRMLTTTEDGGYDLAYAAGSLFVPNFDADVIHRLNADGSVAATINVPTGSGPDQILAAPDGNLYATLYQSGNVVRFAPGAPSGSAATIIGSGLTEPGGIQAGPYGEVDVADNGGGRVLAIATATAQSRAIGLPAGFAPRQLAQSGNDLWVTDDNAARAAIVVDDTPAGLTIAGASAATVAVNLDPRGNDTRVSVTAAQAGGATVTSGTVLLPSAITGAQVPALFRPALTPGDWVLTAHATNARGTADSAPYALHVPATGSGTPLTPTTPRTPPVSAPKPKAPKFADFVTVAPTRRCVANRRVLLFRLRGQPAGRAILSVSVRVGRHKAHRYLPRQLRHGLQLKRLPAHGAYRVTVTVSVATGKSYRKTLTYKACGTRRH
jgi:streptogramin lyase